MNLETLPQKDLNELEHLATQLIAALRKSKLHQEPVGESLREFVLELGEYRRARFDAENPEYHSY